MPYPIRFFSQFVNITNEQFLSRLIIGLDIPSDTYTSLVERLQANNAVIWRGERFTFEATVAEHVHIDANTYPCIWLDFSLVESQILISHIFKQLYKVGCMLELPGEYDIRSNLHIGSDKFYLTRAKIFIDQLTRIGDDSTAYPLACIKRAANELILPQRVSFLRNVAQQLFKLGLAKCSRAAAVLYASVSTVPSNEKINIHIQLSYDKHEQLYLVINFTLTDKNKISNALELFADNKQLTIGANLYAFEVARVNISDGKLLVGEGLAVRIKHDQIHYLLDHILMSLGKVNILVDNKGVYELRKLCQSVSIDSYVKYAQSVIDTMQTDDATCYKFAWLEQMSYEITRDLQAQFVQRVVAKLYQRGFYNCALAMGIYYRDDPYVPMMPMMLGITRFKILHPEQSVQQAVLEAAPAARLRAPTP